MTKINSNDFKTIEGLNLYMRYEYEKNDWDLTFDNIYYKLDDLINDECDEDILLKYLINNTLIDDIMNNWNQSRFEKLCKYIVKKSYVDIINKCIESESSFIYAIMDLICATTDNVELFEKYYNQTDTFSYLCTSLLYKNEPSKLTDHISNNYNLEFNFFKFGMFKKDDVELFKSIISRYKINYEQINILSIILKCPTISDYVEIMETILINSDASVVDIKLFMREIILNGNVEHVEYFLSKYFYDVDQSILFELIEYIKKLPTLKYLIELIGLENFDSKYFCKNIFNFDYDILKWLIDNGFEIILNIEGYYDPDTIFFIIEIHVKADDYIWIKSNARTIINKLFYTSFDTDNIILNNFFEIVPEDALHIDIMFEIFIMDGHFNNISLLLSKNFKPTNILDIIHDLTLLEDQTMLDYINIHF